MRLSTTLSLAAAATAVAGWQIPENQPNGVYGVRVLDNGAEEHVRVGEAVDPKDAQPAKALSARFNTIGKRWNVACYPDEGTQDLDHATCDAANSALDAQCGGGSNVNAGMDFYSISGCVVAYFCNFIQTTLSGTSPTQCKASERQQVSGLITSGCGWYKPGSGTETRVVSGGSGNTQGTVSYGYESYCTARGHDFCSRGING